MPVLLKQLINNYKNDIELFKIYQIYLRFAMLIIMHLRTFFKIDISPFSEKNEFVHLIKIKFN